VKERVKLERDIATLSRSIRLYREQLEVETAQALRSTLQAIAWCKTELASLETEVRKLSPPSHDTRVSWPLAKLTPAER
jgi:hypothetical protein